MSDGRGKSFFSPSRLPLLLPHEKNTAGSILGRNHNNYCKKGRAQGIIIARRSIPQQKWAEELVFSPRNLEVYINLNDLYIYITSNVYTIKIKMDGIIIKDADVKMLRIHDCIVLDIPYSRKYWREI